MPQSPIVAGSEISTPVGGVQMNGAAMRDAALAPGRLAEGIGQDVGALFGGISAKIQEARNAKKVFDADLSMRATKDKFLNDIATDPNLARDSNTWVPALTERVKATQENIMGQPDLAPVVKRHLEQVTGLWGMSTISEVRTQALRKEQADNYAAGISVATKALEDDQDGSGVATATAVYKSLNELGLMGPKEMQQKIAMAPQLSAESQANTVIATNPIDAPRIIQDKLADKLPPQKLRIITHVAAQAQARAQADNQEAISATIDDNPLHTYDEAALKAKRDSGQISVPGYQKLQARMKSYAAASEKDNKEEARLRGIEEKGDFNIAMMQADNPPTDATTLETWAAGIKENGLAWTNPAYRRLLNQHVDAKVKSVRATGQKDEKPIENQIYSLMDEDRMHGGAFIPMATETKTHWFKPDETKNVHYGGGLSDLRKITDEDAEKTFGKGATARSVIAAEQLNYASKREKMRTWFASQEQSGKKPTLEEANAYRQKLESGDIMAVVAQSLGGKRRLVKQGGKTYDYETGQEVK